MPASARFALSKVATLLAFAAVLVASVTIARDIRQSLRKGLRDPNDFVTLYAGAICVTQECNPYSVPDLEAVLRRQRGDEVRQQWADQLPIYPPTTLLVLAPLSVLSYKTATLFWYILSFSVYIAGLLWAFLFSPYLRGKSMVLRLGAVMLGLHFPKVIQCLSFGNPSVLVVGLLLFAVFDDIQARYIPRIVCAGIAVLLKATIALPLMLLVLFSDRARMRRAWVSATAYAVLACGMLIYATVPTGMHHWPISLSGNIALGEKGGMNPSARVTPSNVLLNVANLAGYFTENRGTIAVFTLAVVGLFAAFLSVGLGRLYQRREWNEAGYSAAVPVVAVMTLLPVYHRFCDVALILFVFPWIIQKSSGRMRVTGWVVAPILGLLYFSWERRMHLERLTGGLLRLSEFLYYRGDALLIVVLSGVLVCALYTEIREQTAGVGSALRKAR